VGPEDVWPSDLACDFQSLTHFEGSPPLFDGDELQAHLACQLQAIALDLNVAIAAIDPNCVEDEWPVWRKEIVTAPSGLIDEQYWPVTDSMKTRWVAAQNSCAALCVPIISGLLNHELQATVEQPEPGTAWPPFPKQQEYRVGSSRMDLPTQAMGPLFNGLADAVQDISNFFESTKLKEAMVEGIPSFVIDAVVHAADTLTTRRTTNSLARTGSSPRAGPGPTISPHRPVFSDISGSKSLYTTSVPSYAGAESAPGLGSNVSYPVYPM